MTAEMKSNWTQWILGILMGIIGWLMVMTYGNISSKLNEIQAEIISLKIQIATLQASQLTDTRVNELIDLALHKQQR